jgi:hypothetical protein
MKKNKFIHLAFVLLLTCLLNSALPDARAQSKQNTGTISDVRFIEGSWKAVTADRSIDAVWSAPMGDNMVGYVRVMKDGQVSLYELFAFEKTEQGLVAHVRHFRPGLIAAEEKDTPNRYRFLEASKGRAYFEKQGEETRVLYEKRSEDQFAIVVGKKESGEWVYKDFWVFSRVK